jgi:hypothetical protein
MGLNNQTIRRKTMHAVNHLPFEIRTVGNLSEYNHNTWHTLSAEIISSQREAFREEGPGLPQFVKSRDGVAMHWLSGSDLEYTHILNIVPVYPTPEGYKVEWLHDTFKAIA